MTFLKAEDSRLTNKFGALWQFVKFNLVSASITVLQLLLANLLPLVFDHFVSPLPGFLQPIFKPDVLFDGPTKYVVDGAVTWGYVLPFLLSNGIANIYGYFVNMKLTFAGRGTRFGFIVYVIILLSLILFSTWLQGYIVSLLNSSAVAPLSRTIAALAAGIVQMSVLFPMEKYVLFPR